VVYWTILAPISSGVMLSGAVVCTSRGGVGGAFDAACC
jgi:hypothetical protein